MHPLKHLSLNLSYEYVWHMRLGGGRVGKLANFADKQHIKCWWRVRRCQIAPKNMQPLYVHAPLWPRWDIRYLKGNISISWQFHQWPGRGVPQLRWTQRSRLTFGNKEASSAPMIITLWSRISTIWHKQKFGIFFLPSSLHIYTILIPDLSISYFLLQLSELEQRVAEAESRAEGAEEKVIWELGLLIFVFYFTS